MYCSALSMISNVSDFCLLVFLVCANIGCFVESAKVNHHHGFKSDSKQMNAHRFYDFESMNAPSRRLRLGAISVSGDNRNYDYVNGNSWRNDYSDKNGGSDNPGDSGRGNDDNDCKTITPSMASTRTPTVSNQLADTSTPSLTPSRLPTSAAIVPNSSPSVMPSIVPSVTPSIQPTQSAPVSTLPTSSPVISPTASPSLVPTQLPTISTATTLPTVIPTSLPTAVPIVNTPSPVLVPTTGTGRMIGYLVGWKTPPPVTDIVNAGYTHVLVAFGVFSLTEPGVIVSAFSTITAQYIASLKVLGVRVMLSIGGASTSIPNTTVDFHEALILANSNQAFINTFTQSVQSLMSQYGFEGIDIDIEFGLNAGGTFTNPMGDIAVLATILNTLHTQNANILISLTPQTANIAANTQFTNIWTNYASLIMQTYTALDWVGVQLYNTGCMLGIDGDCYPNNGGNDQTFGVVMAVGLLESWPSVDNQGRLTNFQPYISHLRPDQVVLGYPIPNLQGLSDGSPVTTLNAIRNSLLCLSTGSVGCNSDVYVPPRAYGMIGGVFGWEISYDTNNNYAFAMGLRQCAIQGTCT